MKKKFEITIEERVSQVFEVMAEDEDEAEQIAKQKYSDGAFVLDNSTSTSQQMYIYDTETKKDTGWFDF